MVEAECLMVVKDFYREEMLRLKRLDSLIAAGENIKLDVREEDRNAKGNLEELTTYLREAFAAFRNKAKEPLHRLSERKEEDECWLID